MRRDLICPHCGRVNDTHSAVRSPEPQAGDIGICWKCQGLAIMTPLGFLRAPRDAEELAWLETDREVQRGRAAMAASQGPLEALRRLRRPEAN